ncbi:MAG TPA: GDSL-type esterase/lipase family protein [Actinoplanes sp.]|jgi:lysophospholipase L1-like esterase
MTRRYVALGDSMSIDAYAGGPGRGAASLLHRNRDADFPDWAGRDLSAHGFGLHDLTRDGATTTTVRQGQVPLLGQHPDLVTITMGGNDLMAAFGDDTAAYAVVEQVARTGDDVLRQVRESAGDDATIVMTTVYDPSDGTGAVPGDMLPPWPGAPRLIEALNTALRGLAQRHAALVADVHAHFLGHGAAAGDPGQPHPRPADRALWYCGIIEPNAWGAHEIRRCWWQTIEGAGIPG